MKNFLKEYLKLFSYAAIGLVFMYSSFYLLINYYHSEEVKKTIYVTTSDTNYILYNEKINKLENNLLKYKNIKFKDINDQKLYNSLVDCSYIVSDKGLNKLKTNYYLSSNEIYQLGVNFQSNFLNSCWATYLSNIKNNSKFKDISPFINNEIDIITYNVNDALSEISNNSSYFFTTSITSLTVRNYINADYVKIAKSYNEFLDILLNLSEIINTEGSV